MSFVNRFSAVFTSPEFAVDPNNPAFRKTKAMKSLLEERQSRLHSVSGQEAVSADTVVGESRSMNDKTELNKLVNSIKTKTKKQFSKKKIKNQLNSKK